MARTRTENKKAVVDVDALLHAVAGRLRLLAPLRPGEVDKVELACDHRPDAFWVRVSV